MQRLRGSDAFAIYSETPTSPFVTLKVAIYRPTDENDQPGVDEIDRFIKKAVARQGLRARLRILRVPFDLHHPLWIDDPEYSVDNHLFHAELPSPGTKIQLCDFVSDLMGRPLRSDRPLWEVWVVRGLEGGRTAIVIKLHHALTDGNTVAAMIAESHSTTSSQEQADDGGGRDKLPGKGRIIRDAMLDLVKSYTLDLPEYLHYLKQAREHGRLAASSAVDRDYSVPECAPYTVFNRTGGSERLYRYEVASLRGAKALGKKHACSINTLVMGICSEALRRYMQDVDAVPDQPLVSAMPVGAVGEEDFKTLLNADIHNNSVAVAIVPLDLSIQDFRERLQSIKRISAAAIENVRERGGRRIDNFLDYLPGSAIRLMHKALNKRLEKKKPYANVIISNVKGPQETLYAINGRLRMEELLSSGNLMDAGNLNITVWSYVDKLCFSFYSRKGALPEAEKVNGYVRQVIGELGIEYTGGR